MPRIGCSSSASTASPSASCCSRSRPARSTSPTTGRSRIPTSRLGGSSRRRPACAPAPWRKVARFYTAPGFTSELMHLYLATELTAADVDRLGPDEDEHLLLERMPGRRGASRPPSAASSPMRRRWWACSGSLGSGASGPVAPSSTLGAGLRDRRAAARWPDPAGNRASAAAYSSFCGASATARPQVGPRPVRSAQPLEALADRVMGVVR